MTHYDLVANNKQKSWFIVVFFTLFVLAVSYTITKAMGYGLDALGFALIFSELISFSLYYWSDKIILGISGAKPASREEHFDFYTVSENLAMSQRIPKPSLYVIEDTALNAFATGRDPNHAVICATTGLLATLSRSELEGVVAHELSHIKNYDIRLMSLVTVMVGVISLLSDWMLRWTHFGGKSRDREGNQVKVALFILAVILAILSPLIANLIKLAISRRREFLADASSVAITKNPEGLAKALEKISQDKEPLEAANKATAHLYIDNPLKNVHAGVGWFASLFATHPPIGERITAIRNLSSG